MSETTSVNSNSPMTNLNRVITLSCKKKYISAFVKNTVRGRTSRGLFLSARA